MTTLALGSPVLSGSALRSLNFFNGRLLTGDDLAGEQSALRARLQHLGQLTGGGVAYGLEVKETARVSTPQNPVVTVTGGLALSPSGLALWLPSSIDLSLAGSDATAGSEPGALFAPCQPFAPGTYTAGAGVYLLWVGPASQGDGLAPVNGLGNQVAPCNVDDYIDTVQFGLIRIALTPDQLNDTQHLRNLVAYLCFVPPALASFVSNPFGPPPTTYGLIDELRSQALTDDQVPLAMIAWDVDAGIQFIDLWSVRRRVTRAAAENDFAAFAGDRRRAEGEAMFLQFQSHVADLQQAGHSQALSGGSVFELLPPAGLVPEETATAPGFDVSKLLAGTKAEGPFYMEGAKLEAMFRASFAYPPIDLTSDPVIWLYRVRENRDLPSAATASPQPFVAFSHGLMPYQADAQYDLYYFNYANYAVRGG